MYIAVSQNLLINESSVFRAELSCNWQKNGPGNPNSGLSLRLCFALGRVLAFHLRSDKVIGFYTLLLVITDEQFW